MPEAKRDSTATLVFAGGLISGLAANFLGPKIPAIQNATETSVTNTALVIALGFVIGALITYLALRARARRTTP